MATKKLTAPHKPFDGPYKETATMRRQLLLDLTAKTNSLCNRSQRNLANAREKQLHAPAPPDLICESCNSTFSHPTGYFSSQGKLVTAILKAHAKACPGCTEPVIKKNYDAN